MPGELPTEATNQSTKMPASLRLIINATGGWADTTVDLGEEPVRDELTGREFRGRVPVASVFERYPLALLAVIR